MRIKSNMVSWLLPLLPFMFVLLIFSSGCQEPTNPSPQIHLPDALFINNSLEVTQEQEEILTNLAKLETTADMRLVNINFELLDRDTLGLNFVPGQIIYVSKTKIKIRDDSYTWFGDYLNHTGGVAMVVRNNGLTATFHIDNEIYSIRPIGSGIHVLIHVDWTKFPPDHPPEDSNNQPQG